MTEKRLYAIVLELAAIHAGAVPANHGDQVRGALLKLIQKGDSPLAQQLHDSNEPKPYTISLVKGGKKHKHDQSQHFGEGDRAEWRFTLMMQPVFEALLRKYLLNNNLPHVRIGAINFAIVGVSLSHQAHPDSGHISITELTNGWHQHQAAYPRSFDFDFQSPTTISLGQDKETKRYRYRVFPDSKTVFSHLRKRWIKLGGVAVGDEFDTWVEKHIEAEPLQFNLCWHQVKRRKVRAFTGRVEYHYYGDDERWLPYLKLLADLVFWTGIGYQTTCGMGQVRRLRD